MSRLTVPEPAGSLVVSRPSSSPSSLSSAGSASSTAAVPTAPGLQQQLADLQREVVSLRTQHQRDLATTRGLGEALQSLRRGALALRTENDELRRELTGRSPRRR